MAVQHDAGASTDPRALDGVLGSDPAEAYASMDEPTRARYRAACCDLARSASCSPEDVARAAVELASDGRTPRDRHVGCYLIADRRGELERRLGWQPPTTTRLARWAHQRVKALYLLAFAVVAGGLMLLAVSILGAFDGPPLIGALLAVPIALVSLHLARAVLQRALAVVVPPTQAPLRMDPASVFERGARTLVVTPLIVDSEPELERQLRMLEKNFLLNRDDGLRFGLLTDLADASERELPNDASLLAAIERGIAALNRRYSGDGPPRFLFLHRERRHNAVAGIWMGWERKRGKLAELNRLCLGARDTSYIASNVPFDHLARFRYVFTIDADTALPAGSARRIVSMLEHPLNRPDIDPQTARVRFGYAIVAPRIAYLPSPGRNLLSFAFLGPPVTQPYAQSSPALDLPQAVFAESPFEGKGLYDIEAFARTTAGRIPENLVLSHDKLEGMFARAARAVDVTVLEDHPEDLVSFLRRWHRWARGDAQVLPWCLPWAPTEDGWRANPIDLHQRSALALEVVSRLFFASTLVVMLVAWIRFPQHALLASAIGVGALALEAVLAPAVLIGRAIVWGEFGPIERRRLIGSVLGAVFFCVLSIFFAAIYAPVVLGGTARGFWRLVMRQRSRALEWTPQAKVGASGSGRASVLRATAAAPAIALATGGALYAYRSAALVGAAPILVPWLLAPIVADRAQRKLILAPFELDPASQELVRTIARRTWAAYEQLPSELRGPRDVAMFLLATVSAFDLGFIDRAEVARRLDPALEWLERVETFHGHPCTGRRIATIDAGWLAAALLVVSNAMIELSAGEPSDDRDERGTALRVGERARRAFDRMDFGVLFDEERNQLGAGYDVERHELDPAFEERLASPARLASFVTIAKGAASVDHWLALDRAPLHPFAAGSGSTEVARELIAPSLVMLCPAPSVIARAASVATRARDELGKAAPPDLALDLLALRFSRRPALDRLAQLDPGGALGADGSEAPRELELAMALAAANNALNGDAIVRRFHRAQEVAALDYLLYEAPTPKRNTVAPASSTGVAPGTAARNARAG